MEELWGRKVLKQELNNVNKSLACKPQCLPTMEVTSETMISCLRCGQQQKKECVQLDEGSYFCPECIQLGRVDSSQYFYHLPEPKSIERKVCLAWSGTLTEGQKKVSDELVKSVKESENRMVWAVTGAGKTEMLFDSLRYSLEKGYRIGLASPRVDVCLELFPRIQAVFPQEKIILLHGKMEEKYVYTKLVVCTTHQLLRFYQAFDVLIVDEVDAFPFVNNPSLHYGVEKSLKKKSSLIYLTATPTKELLKQVSLKKLAVSVLPARYHRRQLPVPKKQWCNKWREKVNNVSIPNELGKKIRHLSTKNDVLIFCPSISMIQKLERGLKKIFPGVPLTCVHAQDKERVEKVIGMWNKQFRLFITSTILERGVTFEGISVIVLGANHHVFSSSALVQITGRVDRKMVYSAGEVWFFHDGQSLAMKEAIKQIKWMNHLAQKRGLLDEM